MVTKRLVLYLAVLVAALSGATLTLALQSESDLAASIGILCAVCSVAAVLVAWSDLR